MATTTMTETKLEPLALAHSKEPGTVGNLTPAEERKLQEAWVHLLRLCGTELAGNKTPDRSRDFWQHLSNKSPKDFKRRLWSFNLAEHPDVTVLRFLRARKWDVEASMAMLLSAINWREERRIDEDVVYAGEGVGLKESPTADEKGFVMQYRSGKSYVRGTDKEGRPVYVIRVKLHDPSKQSSQSMETYVLHNIESLRVMASSPNDKACLLFDLTGFGLKNMDFHVVKFLVQVFEARYPETLGIVLIHNAPFVFWGIWSIIKGWLDPVIASKINFTSKPADLAKFIPKENLQKRYGGQDPFDYSYIEPEKGENDQMELKEKRAGIQAARDELTAKFEQLTTEWISQAPDSDAAKSIDLKRRELAIELRKNYWDLDPFTRAKTYYHRAGVMTREGEVDFKAAK